MVEQVEEEEVEEEVEGEVVEVEEEEADHHAAPGRPVEKLAAHDPHGVPGHRRAVARPRHALLALPLRPDLEVEVEVVKEAKKVEEVEE